MKMKETMPIMTILAALAICALMVAGCGGGGSGSGSGNGSGSLSILGSWSGHVVITSSTPDETFAASINITNQSSGVFSGTINVGTTGDMPFSGTVNSDGSSLAFTYTRSDGLVVNGTGTATATRLSGTFTNSAGESGTFSFTRGSLSIVGSWSGHVVITSSTPDETFAAAINVTSQSSGVFSGTINVGFTGDMSFNGTVNSDGSSLVFTYTRSDGLVVNGTGTATATTLSGTFTNSAGESGRFSFTKS